MLTYSLMGVPLGVPNGDVYNYQLVSPVAGAPAVLRDDGVDFGALGGTGVWRRATDFV